MQPITDLATYKSPSSMRRRMIRWVKRIRRINAVGDRLYLKALYRLYMGHRLNLAGPRTFNEKIQWLKLNYRRPDLSLLTDKIEVKKYAARVIGEEYIIPTLAVWDSPDDIDPDMLPDRFVLKCNHSGGNRAVFVVHDKSTFDFDDARKKLRKCLHSSLYRMFAEWSYKDIQPRILAEELIDDTPDDYKFNCYDGHAESVMVCNGRGAGDTKFYFFDRGWNLKRYNLRGIQAAPDFTLPKPEGIDLMFGLAEKLSAGFPFVRVDLYNVRGRIYFGEMTFYPCSGFDNRLLPATDRLFGDMINLPGSPGS